MIATAYLWHNYGKSAIGSRADIENVPIDRLAAFYQKYYQPDNAVLVVAGQFDASKALGDVAETVGAIPRPTRKLDETYTVEPVQDGERSVELRRVGNEPGGDRSPGTAPALAHPDSAALEVLGGIMTRRRARRRHRPPLQGAGGQQERRLGPHGIRGTARSRIRHRVRDAEQRPVARRRAQDDDRHDRGVSSPNRRRKKRWSARRPASLQGMEQQHGQLAAGRARVSPT